MELYASMITLEKTIKITKMNRKGTGKWSKLKEGDEVRICFDVNGIGGKSPMVDIFINGSYSHSPYARNVNDTLFNEKQCMGKPSLSPMVASYEEVKQ